MLSAFKIGERVISMSKRSSGTERYDEKIEIPEKYTLALSFRFSRNSRVFKSSIVLLERQNGLFKEVFKIDDAHNFRHVHIGDSKGPAFAYRFETTIKRIKDENVIELPDEWIRYYSITDKDFLNFYLFNGGPLIVCPPLKKLGKKIIEISKELLNSKQEVKTLHIPGFYFLILPKEENIKTSFVFAEEENINEINDFIDKYCLKK